MTAKAVRGVGDELNGKPVVVAIPIWAKSRSELWCVASAVLVLAAAGKLKRLLH